MGSAIEYDTRDRIGYTGNYPVIAGTPLMDEFLGKDATD